MTTAPVEIHAEESARSPRLPQRPVTESGEKPMATRGHRESALRRLRGDIPIGLVGALTMLGVVALLGLWGLASTVWSSSTFQVATLAATWSVLVEMARAGELWTDLRAELDPGVIRLLDQPDHRSDPGRAHRQLSLGRCLLRTTTRVPVLHPGALTPFS